MNKIKKLHAVRMLKLEKETLGYLTNDQLKAVAGGSPTTRPSQCPTLCF